MTESESRTLTTDSSTDPKAVKTPRAHAELEALKVAVFGKAAKPQPRYPGTATEYALKVRADWTANPGKVKTLTGALKQACQRYDQKDGSPFTVPSLRELLRKHDQKRSGNPL
jgi:hypothetical protein